MTLLCKATREYWKHWEKEHSEAAIMVMYIFNSLGDKTFLFIIQTSVLVIS